MKKCEKCSNELDGDAKFCGKCGNKVEEKVLKEPQETKGDIGNETISNIKNHLEFLGYKAEYRKGENGDLDMLVSTHPSKANLVASFTKESSLTSFATTWTGLKEIKSVEQYKLLNKLTANSNLAQVVITDNADLRLYGLYIGHYDKKIFSTFIETFLDDNTRVLSNEEFKKLFVA